MVEPMQKIILKVAFKLMCCGLIHFSESEFNVTTIDDQYWIYVHVYVMKIVIAY
jgi:preprotein translocase subunit Sec61beta